MTWLNHLVNKDTMESLKNKKAINETSYTEQSDSQKYAIMRTLDGHKSKNQGEVVVDIILYNNQICHCYEKVVIEISSNARTVKFDWYILVYRK